MEVFATLLILKPLHIGLHCKASKVVHTIIHEWFGHKLNYFLFCQNFEKIFFIYVKFLITIIKLKFDVFDYQVELQAYQSLYLKMC